MSSISQPPRDEVADAGFPIRYHALQEVVVALCVQLSWPEWLDYYQSSETVKLSISNRLTKENLISIHTHSPGMIILTYPMGSPFDPNVSGPDALCAFKELLTSHNLHVE